MNQSPRESMEALASQWAQAIVLESVHCRRCGYDLRGLRADGRCPECGLEIWTSVLHTVDPAASRLPSLRNPRAVGNSLLALTICMFIGTVLLIAPSVSQLLDSNIQSGVPVWSRRLPSLTWWNAALIALLGLWAVRVMAPPRGSEPMGTIWNDIWRMVFGLLGWLAFGAGLIHMNAGPGMAGMRQQFALHLAMALFATIGLIGLRGVLNVIGQRSREYRRSRGGRQSVELIIAAIAAGVLGMALQYASAARWLPHMLGAPSQVIIWVSSFMILIGLAYLVMNAWWIRRALRRPAPPLDQVLAIELPPDSWIPDREE